MTVDYLFDGDPSVGTPPQITTWQQAKEFAKRQEKQIQELTKENDYMRAVLAYSKEPCVHCKLPAADWGKCSLGFPGCARADDAICRPDLAPPDGETELSSLR